MKKEVRQFLLISFLFSFICFGLVVYSKTSFLDLKKNPLYLVLFLLGFMGPTLGGAAVYYLNPETFGGMKGLRNDLKYIPRPKQIWLIPAFLAVNYGAMILLQNIAYFGRWYDFFKYFPLLFVLLGLQEIGWTHILHNAYEESRGFWKANIIKGLFQALWFLPLIFIPNFMVLPQAFAQFAAYLVGFSVLITTVFQVTQSLFYAMLLSTSLFAMASVLQVKQGYLLLLVAAINAIASAFVRQEFLVPKKTELKG